ncbi:phospholipid carrier-dependent glycosyltransferase [Streptomyces sp. NPDC001922]|uniref:phospholipid carrier-dependent glycosyltransferase n=1 Tax=Streptomyces sp. NPDC001922 TaxID=3364624 RepID=UPI0036C89C49
MTHEHHTVVGPHTPEPTASPGLTGPGTPPAPSAPSRSGPAVSVGWTGLPDLLRRHRRRLFVVAVVALLTQMAVAMVSTAVEQTPTIDEPVYAGTAAVYLHQHSLRYNPEHPPLGKLIIASGLAFGEARLASGFTGNQTELGRHLLYESGNDPQHLLLQARMPVIVTTLLFGLVVLAFARDLAGPVGGLCALALYAFSPDVIAHGSLATLDVPAAGFLLTAVWSLWRARRHRLPLHLALAGAALGAALATKMSTLAAVPVLLVLTVVTVRHALRRRREGQRPPSAPPGGVRHGVRGAVREALRDSGREAGRESVRKLALGAAAALGVALVAVAVVWAAYLVVDPRLRWAPPADLPVIRGLRGLVTGLLPFPEPYRDGMLIQFGFEYAHWSGFLFGRHYDGSLWYYLPAALLVKTPLGMLALWAAGSTALLTMRRLRPAAPYVLLPAAVLLAAALHSSRDLGVRYAVFLPMLLAVAAAAVCASRRRWAHGAAAALTLFVAVSSLRTYPYYLPYANEAFGGPAGTHRHLHDSNVDWGQDLGRLADRLRHRYRGERIWLVYKGSGVPAFYGIHASNPLKAPANKVRGLLVVSDSSLAKAEGRLARLIESSERVDDVGHSITIFRRR